MHKAWLFTILFISQLTLSAQQFKVENFYEDPSDVSAIRHEKTDVNGYKCAIIKVRSNTNQIQFDSNLGITDSEYRDREIWLYVSPGEQSLKFMGEGMITKDYELPVRIEESKVYILELLASGIKTEESLDMPSQWFIINSNPEGADVYIDGDPAGKTPYQNELPTGTHFWKLTSELYKPDSGKVQLKSGDDNKKHLNITLEPDFGNINLRSSPENGASISLNGIDLNKQTPAMLTKIPTGEQTLTLSMDDYETTRKPVTIEAGDTIDIDVEMRPTFAEVAVYSEPEADIYINNEKKDHESWKGRLNPGIITFEARKNKHHPHKIRKEITAGDTMEIELTPEPITGDLQITTIPIGAFIYLDGEKKGTTPATLRDLIIGEHKLKLSKEGFVDVERMVNIGENEINRIDEELPSGISVTINSAPKNADLIIDGRKAGATPNQLKLKPGPHELTLKHEDKKQQETIHVSKNSTNFLIRIKECNQQLEISTSPDDAKIYVDDERVGTGSTTYAMTRKSHEIEARHPDYQNKSKRVKCGNTRINIELEKEEASPATIVLELPFKFGGHMIQSNNDIWDDYNIYTWGTGLNLKLNLLSGKFYITGGLGYSGLKIKESSESSGNYTFDGPTTRNFFTKSYGGQIFLSQTFFVEMGKTDYDGIDDDSDLNFNGTYYKMGIWENGSSLFFTYTKFKNMSMDSNSAIEVGMAFDL